LHNEIAEKVKFLLGTMTSTHVVSWNKYMVPGATDRIVCMGYVRSSICLLTVVTSSPWYQPPIAGKVLAAYLLVDYIRIRTKKKTLKNLIELCQKSLVA